MNFNKIEAIRRSKNVEGKLMSMHRACRERNAIHSPSHKQFVIAPSSMFLEFAEFINEPNVSSFLLIFKAFQETLGVFDLEP